MDETVTTEDASTACRVGSTVSGEMLVAVLDLTVGHTGEAASDEA